MKERPAFSKGACFAEAIYSNKSEYPNELAFERGDVLKVLSTKPEIEGISEGWWLCIDRKGTKGVVPANRLQIMHTLDGNIDKEFFEVANPLFGDFFMFSHAESPFEDSFFRGSRLFPSSVRDRLDPLRRVNSCDETLKTAGVVRNIPIRIVAQKDPPPAPEPRFNSSFNSNYTNSPKSFDQGFSSLRDPEDDFRSDFGPAFGTFGRRFSDFPQTPRELRRTVSSGRVSPPTPPTRKFVSTQNLVDDPYLPGPQAPKFQQQHPQLPDTPTASSESDEDRPASTTTIPQRTLVIPSSVPGRTIEIPLGGSTLSLASLPSQQRAREAERQQATRQSMRDRNPEHTSQMEKLTQRLRNLAGKPFRSLSSPTHSDNSRSAETKKIIEEEPRTPSPSSSGICADLTDPSSSEEKRTSDISSLSGASDQNSSLSDANEDSRINVPIRIPQQPYLSRLAPSTSNNDYDNAKILKNPVRPSEEQNGSRREWSMPSTVEEDMRRNRDAPWTTVPTRVVHDRTQRSVGDILEEELQSRKRVVCNKLTDCMRILEQYAVVVNKCTAAQHWRAAHILQGNMSKLRDSAREMHDALESFMETTGRISIERTNSRYVEMNQLLAPLSDARQTLATARKQLDEGGWTVAVLSRPQRDRDARQDALDMFVQAARQVPSDCRRIVQWVQLLVPSNSILFLSPSTSTTSRLSPVQTPTNLAHRTLDRPVNLLNAPLLEENHRLSTSSTSTIGGGSDKSSDSSSQPSSILVTSQNRMDKPQRGRVTFADEKTDRSSTGSSIDNSSVEYATIQKSPIGQTPILGQTNGYGSQKAGYSNPTESRIMEEDDLESVVSDRESLFQDYAYLDDAVPGRANGNSRIVDDEDRELVRFYSPQLEQHTEALTMAVEQFLQTVENNLPPREFVQKGKLIILAAHKLIYMGDSVSQCIRNAETAKKLRGCADCLCAELKNCVQSTKVAADEYPDIKCMQEMVDSVMKVSAAAHDLKFSMRSFC